MHDPLYDALTMDTTQREAQLERVLLEARDAEKHIEPEPEPEPYPTPEEKTMDKMGFPNNRAGRRAAAKAARRGAR